MNRSESAAFLRDGDQYVLLTHKRPDGDTLGSASALCRALRALGKQAWILKNNQVTPKYQEFVQDLVINDVSETVTLVAIDIASVNQLAYGHEALAERVALCIDHHGSNTGFAARSWVDADAAACGELIWDLIQELGVPVSVEMATALYLAVASDTGCFRHGNTTPNSFRCAAALKEHGAENFRINRSFFVEKTPARFKLEALLAAGMESYAGGAIMLCTLTPAMLAQAGACEDDTDDLANFPRQVAGCQIAVYIRELPTGEGKVSLRTDPAYDASDICATYGGGGHHAAAGCTIPGGVEAAKRAILQAIHKKTGLA